MPKRLYSTAGLNGKVDDALHRRGDRRHGDRPVAAGDGGGGDEEGAFLLQEGSALDLRTACLGAISKISIEVKLVKSMYFDMMCFDFQEIYEISQITEIDG